MRKLLVVLAAGLLLAADKPKGDAARLEGEWEAVSAEKCGNSLDDIKDAKVVIKDGKLTLTAPDRGDTTAPFKLDPTKKPSQIDFTPSDGPLEGKTLKGIYQLKGDELKLCVSTDPDKERPTEFASKDGSDTVLLVLKRKKP